MASKEKKNITKAAQQKVSAEVTSSGKNSFLYQKLLILLVAFFTYANGISNGYNFDDELYVTKAQQIASQPGWGIASSFRDRTFSDGENNYEYRPVSLLSLVWQYKFISNAPEAGHLINVLIYAASCLLLFILLRKWFGESKSLFAFFCAILFCIHPIHTEVVDSIKSRDELLSGLFMIAALLLIWVCYERKSVKYGVLSGVFLLLAKLSKKTFIVLTPIVPLSLWFFDNVPFKKIIKYIAIMLFAYLVLALLLHMAHSGSVRSRVFYEHENPFYINSYNMFQRIPTGLYVMGRYLLLLVAPIQLAYYYGYSYVPIAGWGEPAVWVSLAVHAALLYFILKGIRNKSLFSFGGIVYLLCVFAFSNILKPAPGIMAERFMYGASIGFCIMLCATLYRLLKIDETASMMQMKRNRQFAFALSLIVCLFCVRTFARNADWKDKYTLYTHDMSYLENSSKANVVHGQFYKEIGDKYKEVANNVSRSGNAVLAGIYMDSSRFFTGTAERNFLTALKITPNLSSAASYLGLLYAGNDNLPAAKYYFGKALSGMPRYASLNCNMGIVYFRMAEYDSAQYYIKKAINYDSGYTLAYKNLYDLLITRNDTAEAIHTLQVAAKHIRNPIAAYVDLATTFLWKGDTAQAVKYYEEAATLKPGSANALLFLKNYYHSKNDPERAAYYDGLMTQLMTERQTAE